ncbi:MAG: trypsin-like peptidase domain-containing protein [Nocardioidaceae bacterium]
MSDERFSPPQGGQLPPPPPDQQSGFGPRGATATAPYPRPYGAVPPGFPPYPPAPAAEPRPRRSRGIGAGVMAASLVLGAGAGVGGSVLWNSTQDGTTTTASSANASPAVHQGAAPATGSVEQVASAVLPSVVKIDVAGSTEAGSGSGIILSSDGEILTNNHVVEIAGDGGSIEVLFNDGSHASAKVLGTDPLTDTAVIKADGVSGLTPATIGQSGQLRVGQQVVAIGSPFGLQSTVTSGIVSALNRPVNVGQDNAGNATVYPAIQTDAAINPGNSGGPLVDMNGDVVGINASIRTASSNTGSESGSIGLGFSIPIDEVMPIVDQMVKGETPTHAKMGVSIGNVTGGSTSLIEEGAEVGSVTPGSAAAKAGLQQGDIITKVDDQQITGADSLIATVRSYRPGDQVTVTWERNGKEMTATVTLGSDGATS